MGSPLIVIERVLLLGVVLGLSACGAGAGSAPAARSIAYRDYDLELRNPQLY